MLILELTAPADPVAGFHRHLLLHQLFGILNKSDQVAPLHIGDHHAVAAAHLPVNLDRTVCALDVRHVCKRHGVAVFGGDPHRPEISGRYTHAFCAAQHDGRAAITLNHAAGFAAFNLRAQRVLDFLDAQAQSAGLQAVYCHLQILHAIVFHGVHILVAFHRFQQRLDFARVGIEFV